MSFALLSVVLGAFLLFAIKWLLTGGKTARPLPPGPSGKPVIGNISDLPGPGTPDWVHWLKHKQLYGT